ncbi:sigma-70 family RNA polymerase sigma factor [Candidatus Sulfidibacterium hydrothermale]|uniref:RNA polymerase sigma factor n=1 Tax=Candidatus Sulfidibacterium hydrothermale TaxID=2875962 RepID=UPI001F0B604F|nr:sigma-70 family RNA polymerase sigma factor [Candidatus Sulfidibacterium hydrothermale]UBM62810.1 sigma-70 family RNA polymerase sigma factor [Candidatus Sulfidibacterium hydrothermale]
MKMEANDERQLVRKFLDGNPLGLQELIERHQTRVYSYIFVMVKDKQLADDLFQDTFVKVINTIKSGSYNDEGKFIQWVMRIAHNLVIDHFRKQKKLNLAEVVVNDQFNLLDTLKVSDPGIEDVLVTQQIHRDIKKLMEYLPQEQKEVIYLRCYAGMSFKDIAEQTEVSINTALGRMRYALINLRKMIKEKNIILTR